MANEEIVAQYNQLVWQMEQLRAEVHEAGESYINKLKSIKKRMQRTNEQLENLSKDMARRQIYVGGSPSMAQPGPVTAGFHPSA